MDEENQLGLLNETKKTNLSKPVSFKNTEIKLDNNSRNNNNEYDGHTIPSCKRCYYLFLFIYVFIMIIVIFYITAIIVAIFLSNDSNVSDNSNVQSMNAKWPKYDDADYIFKKFKKG